MAGSKIKVALIRGGKSSEREVSLASGHEILTHIDKNRFDVSIYDPADELAKLIAEAANLDVAFLALHGLYGEDGAIQGFCELIGLPYTGSGILGSAQAMNKAVSKNIYRENKLPVAADLTVVRGLEPAAETAGRAGLALGLPVVVKPATQGSSVGLSIAKTEAELIAALDLAFSLDDLVILEEYLKGRELTCAVIGNDHLTALPPIEIIPAPGHNFFDYSAKYEPGQAEEICPANIPEKLTAQMADLALSAHKVLNLRGLSRTDFILTEGGLYLLETNTLPGLTSGSLLPKSAKAFGFSYQSMISYIIDLALAVDSEPAIENYKTLQN